MVDGQGLEPHMAPFEKERWVHRLSLTQPWCRLGRAVWW
jgi:hypothetical protein